MLSATIIYVEGNYIFNAGRKTRYETVIFPIPLLFKTQAPIYLDITANPSELVSKITLERGNHGNTFVHLVTEPMNRGQDLFIDWICPLFIVNQLDQETISKQNGNDFFDDVQSFLRPSFCVQSENAQIKRKATSLKSPDNDIPKTIRNILHFIQELKTKADFNYNRLDALEALQHGGSCVSVANLAAALLRANEIPARILATHPTWFPRHQTHYIVEAFVDSDWIAMDPSRGTFPDSLCKNPVVAVVDIQNEDKSISRWQYPMSGVPYLSLPEKLTPGDIGYRCPKGGPHQARIIRKFEDSPDLIENAFIATRESWSLYIENVAEKPIMPKTPSPLIKAANSQHTTEYLELLSSRK